MKIFLCEHFKRQLKKLKKKFPYIKEDFLRQLHKINIEQEISLGKSIYKVRIASSDMNRGKSGGFRTYVYLFRSKNLLVPLCIYAKSDVAAISDRELQYHFEKVAEEIQ